MKWAGRIRASVGKAEGWQGPGERKPGFPRSKKSGGLRSAEATETEMVRSASGETVGARSGIAVGYEVRLAGLRWFR